jgi:hypothetical protein
MLLVRVFSFPLFKLTRPGRRVSRAAFAARHGQVRDPQPCRENAHVRAVSGCRRSGSLREQDRDHVVIGRLKAHQR